MISFFLLCFFLCVFCVDFAYCGKTIPSMYLTNPWNMAYCVCNIMQKWLTLWSTTMAVRVELTCCFRVHCAAAPASLPSHSATGNWQRQRQLATATATKLGSGYVLAAILFYYYYTLYMAAEWAKVLQAEPDRTTSNCFVCPSKTKLLLARPHFGFQ